MKTYAFWLIGAPALAYGGWIGAKLLIVVAFAACEKIGYLCRGGL